MTALLWFAAWIAVAIPVALAIGAALNPHHPQPNGDHHDRHHPG